MEACPPVSSISEDFGPRVNNTFFCCKLTYVGPKQCSKDDSAEENVKLITLEDLSDFQGCIVDKVHSKVEELGTALSSLHVEGFLDHKISSEPGECSLKCGTGCLKDDTDVSQQDASDGIMKKSFSRSATFPCSDKMCPSLPVGAEEPLPSTQLLTECSPKFGNVIYAWSTSLPGTSKLVSAMKGGREKEGAPPKAKLTVKWAPDVYDPPTTSMSHILKNHYQRPKSKKRDYHKHKNKNKSSRHGHQSNICSSANSQYKRLQVPESSSVFNVSAHSSVRARKYAASGQESKCGSSVHVGYACETSLVGCGGDLTMRVLPSM